MTNLEFLTKINWYDFLADISRRNEDICVVDMIDGGRRECPDNDCDKCERCIQAWLNEEA